MKNTNIQKLRKPTENIFFLAVGMTVMSAFVSWGACMTMLFLTIGAFWGVVLTHEEWQD